MFSVEVLVKPTPTDGIVTPKNNCKILLLKTFLRPPAATFVTLELFVVACLFPANSKVKCKV